MESNSDENPEFHATRNGKTNLALNCVWWKKRRTTEKRIYVLCILLLLLCLALIIVNVMTESRNRTLAKEETSRVCSSKECVTAAARILENFDPTADPCKDFYQFACGNYIRQHTVPDDRYFVFNLPPVLTMQHDLYVTLKKRIEIPVSGNDPLAVIQAKNLYASCMNTSNIEDGSVRTLMHYLNKTEFGEWPISNPNWEESSADFERMLAKLFVHGIKPFFDISVKAEDRNSSKYFLSISFDDSFTDNKYFRNSSNSNNVQYVLSYKKLLYETFHLLGVSESNFKKDMEDMLNFEVEFSKISSEDYSSSDKVEVDNDVFMNKVKISILEKEMPEIKWSLFLDYIYNDFHLPKRKHDLNISLESGAYMKNLAHLIKKTSPRTVANYLSWKFVRKYLPYLSIRFQQLNDEFFRNSPTRKHVSEESFSTRWKECVHLARERFGKALLFLYVKEDYQKSTENEVAFIISSLKKAFIEGIHKQSWLTNNSKIRCEEKINGMGSQIGYAPQMLDPSQLNAEYEGLTILPDQFLENILQMNRYDEYKLFRKLAGVIKEEMKNLFHPLEVSAYYDKNIMYFSASILKIPFFNTGCPRYVNYGTFGVLVGHEMTHGFDSGEEVFEDLFPKDKTEVVMKQIECYIEQYSQFLIDVIDKNIDGDTSLLDNVCDCTGVAQAYRAYRNYESKYGEEPLLPGIEYSNEQVFFLSYAQMYCEVLNKENAEKYVYSLYSPGRYRANGPLMNLPEFSNVFNCPEGSPMNPVKKCKLWN